MADKPKRLEISQAPKTGAARRLILHPRPLILEANEYSAEQVLALRAVENLATLCEYEEAHCQRISHFALRLFDDLQPLHHLGETERFFLQCAAILHDIGRIEGWKGHHRASLNIILRTPMLPFNNRERLIIGSVARYHTKALPSLEHDHFAALQPEDRKLVLMLAGLLRLADSLDRTHTGMIEDIRCKVTPEAVLVRYVAGKRARKDEKAAIKGSDLLVMVLERQVQFKWSPV